MTKNIITCSLLLIGICFCTSALYSQNWKVEQYTEEKGLQNNYLYSLSYEKEKILLGSDAGLILFDGHNFEVDDYFKNTYPISLHRGSNSSLYISTYRNGIYLQTPNSLEKISTSHGNLSIKGFDTNFVIYDVYVEKVLISTGSNRKLINQFSKYPNGYGLLASKEGLYCFYQNTLELIDWKGNKKETRNLNEDITTVFSLGKILFTGHEKGKLVRSSHGAESQTFELDTDFDIQNIYKYNDSSLIVVNTKNEYDQLYFLKFNKDFTKILHSEKILNQHVEINDVLIKNGTVFCATYGEGLYVLSPTDFLTIDMHSQNLPRLTNLIQDEYGTIWGSSVQNVYKVDVKKGLSKLTFSSKLISIIHTKNDKSYISIDIKGLCDMDLNIVSPSIIKEVFYSNDSTLFGYGKYQFLEVNTKQNTENILFSIINNKAIYGTFNSGAIADNVVYLGTDIGLIKLVKTNHGKWKEAQQSNVLNCFNRKKITQTIYDGDTLFIIAEGRLYYYVNDKIEEFVFSNIQDIQVNKIMFDSKSNLFIGTDKGFWYLTPTESFHYDKSNGLMSDKVYNFLEDRDSNIWIVTGKSLEIINYKDLHSVAAPLLYFKKTFNRSDGVSLTISSYQYDFPNDLELEYKLNDEAWIPLKTSFLELRNLAPESYKCQIRGKRNNSGWSAYLVYNFEVQAKWYQTNKFKFLIFFAVLNLCIILFLLRLKQVRAKNAILENEIAGRKRLEKKVNNLREEISQDFHDELGNKIASISGISNGMIESVGAKNVPKVQEISKLSSEMYDSTKDFVWLLDPSNNNLQSLCLYLRDYGENYFDLIGNIDFFFHQENIQEIPIAYEWMKNIVLTFKEITANVIKHSSATEVTMDVKLQDTIFSIEIYDNGQGFSKTEVIHGNGLRNIILRMQKLNAEISTDFSDGVKYCFELKMK